MSFTVTFDDHGLIQRVARAQPAIAAALEQTIVFGALDFEGAVIQHTPSGATGHLRQSITHEISGSGAFIEGRVYSTDVPIKVSSVEHGRAPGKLPPLAPVELWVRRVLGISDPSVVFLIRRAIGRRGTKPAGMFQDGFRDGLPRFNARVAQLMREIRGTL